MKRVPFLPPEHWGQEYEKQRHKMLDFEQRLRILIKDIFRANRIDENEILEGVHSRTKAVDSFVEKIEKKKKEGKSYRNPLNEITDLVGIRIVTYYVKDIERIKNAIRKEFDIDEENTVDKMRPEGIDRFGYESFHFVVSISKKRLILPEYKSYSGLKAEIQLRTVLQHAWASIDHTLRYKTISEAPDDLKRKLFRLSALLELADDEFYSIKTLSDKRNKKIEESLESGVTDIDIDIDSLRNYLSRKTREVKKVQRMARNAGIKVEDMSYFDTYLLMSCKKLDMNKLTMLIAYLMDINETDATKALKRLSTSIDFLSLQGIIIFLFIYKNVEKFHIEDFDVPKYEKSVLEIFVKTVHDLKIQKKGR